MRIDFTHRHALIGGSSRGIGRAIARQLAESGASVTVLARSAERLRELVGSLPDSGGRTHRYLEVDYEDWEAYSEIVGAHLAQHPADILVNNTQGPPAGGALEKGVEDYQKAFDLLFKSVVATTERALPHMRAQGWGRVINVASVSIKEPLDYLVLSNSIRAAVATWAKGLAGAVGGYGITVNNVLTGYFDTERIAELNARKAQSLGVSPDEVLKEMVAKVPVGRIGDPAEYGYLVAFLASDRAAYLNGANIPIDGGLLRSL